MKNRRNIVEQKYPPENPNDIWLKDGKFYRSTSEGWVVIDSKTEYTSKESMIVDNPKGGTIGINKETGEASIYNDVANQWSPLNGGGVTSITWLELKDKRDAGKLIPGSLYRITDYQCTTSQENTKSAGHQFDIVLLALSENKLAEEGWAMMNESNVYDVTFSDGVTKKCWIYQDDYVDNIVDCTSLLGNGGMAIGEDDDDDVVLNKTNRTAICKSASSHLHDSDLTYNYFQNSNLSAWKVWYSLDNDKSRFAWADDSVDEDIPESIIYVDETDTFTYYRNSSIDTIEVYGWSCDDPNAPYQNLYTQTLTIIPGVTKAALNSTVKPSILISGYNSAHEGTNLPNGRGVIYRLIDEWNNDVAYDFKNIVIYLGGKIEEGYLFSSDDGDIFSDMSLTGIFNDIIVKKTIDDNNCQVIDIGIFVISGVVGYCNVIVASGALSENGVNTLSSNVIFGYTII